MTERIPIGDLYAGALPVQSRDVDWSELDWPEGFEFYEAPDCPECDGYCRWRQSAWRCVNRECAQLGVDFDELGGDRPEGPMMNSHYPLPTLGVATDGYNAAERICDLPLCVIEWPGDGGFSLALTGGGMDLSWEICEAFTRLGFLPPVRFSDLPIMSGYPRDDDDRYVMAACRRSAFEYVEHARRESERIVRTLDRLEGQATAVAVIEDDGTVRETWNSLEGDKP